MINFITLDFNQAVCRENRLVVEHALFRSLYKDDATYEKSLKAFASTKPEIVDDRRHTYLNLAQKDLPSVSEDDIESAIAKLGQTQPEYQNVNVQRDGSAITLRFV